MPREATERERQGFLAGPRVAVLSIAGGDDRPPHTTPVWYAYRPGWHVTVFTGTQGRRSRKADLLRRAGILSLMVQQEEFPYRYATVEGTVVGEDRPPSAGQVFAHPTPGGDMPCQTRSREAKAAPGSRRISALMSVRWVRGAGRRWPITTWIDERRPAERSGTTWQGGM